MDKKYIDANELQACIERKHGMVGSNERWTEGYNDAINRIKSMVHSFNAADVQEVRHWISVKDRLPEQGKRVLVFVKALGEINNIHKDVIATNFITDTGNWCNIGSDYIVTHWMPLPESPRKMDGGKKR